jgi:osmoprotectant transport system ATP-binding protein
MISLQAVSKVYDTRTALYPTTLEFAAGQTHVLLGSSGGGKSTILRLICGLIDATSGKVMVNGEEVSTRVQRRMAQQIGYVIQEGGLFPHLSAKENVVLAARIWNWSDDKIQARVNELMRLVQLDSALLAAYPRQLSGGQRQRVALMRALMLDPPILILDEPLAALDPLVRSELQVELKRIGNEVKKTIILVTHDIGEGAFFGHTISLLHNGQLVQHGEFADFVNRPANEFVSRFIKAQTPPSELLEALR